MRTRAHCPSCGQPLPVLHDCHVDEEARRLVIGDRRVDLTRQEWDCFALLYKRRPRLVTRDSLIIELWQDEEPENADGSLKQVICKLRRALRDGDLHIETIYQSGYRLIELERPTADQGRGRP